MARTRERSKGRLGAEVERFARLPEAVLKSGAYWSLSHGAARILTLLLCGRTEQQNGRFELTDAQARKFGLKSHDLLARSLPALIRVGLIEQTRRIKRKARHAAHYAVTWWKVYYRDGVKLEQPESASHAYLKSERKPSGRSAPRRRSPVFCSPRSSGDVTPMIGVKSAVHHPDGASESMPHHPDDRGTLKSLGEVSGFAATLCRLSAQLRAPVSNPPTRKAEAQSGEARRPSFANLSANGRGLAE